MKSMLLLLLLLLFALTMCCFVSAENNSTYDESKTIQFSILVKPTANITAADIQQQLYHKGDTHPSDTTNNAYDLWITVIDVTTTLLCQKTNFEMFLNGTDTCNRNNNSTPQNTNTNNDNSTTTMTPQFSAGLDKVGVVVKDGSAEVARWGERAVPLKWLTFTIHYPIRQTGGTSKKSVYKIAKEAIRQAIDDAMFTNQLPTSTNNDIMAVANVGEENISFFPWAQLWESLSSLPVVGTDDYDDDDDTTTIAATHTTTTTSNQQQPHAFFYPIRIAGVSLLWFTIVFVTFMMCLARTRKINRQQQHEEEQQKRLRGGGIICDLRTPNGLNEMLQVGREVSLSSRRGGLHDIS